MPLFGVLSQVLKRLMQAHVVLLIGGVLRLNEMNALLATDVDVETHYCYKNHRDVQLITQRRKLLVELVGQVVGQNQ